MDSRLRGNDKKMLKLIESRKIWENFLEKYSPQAFFQSWSWGDVQEKMHQKVWRMGYFQKGELTGIAQITLVEAKRGRYIHIRHGPIFINNNQELWKSGILELIDFAKQNKSWFMRISPLIHLEEKKLISFSNFNFIESPVHSVDAELCWVLDLDKTPDELMLGMRKTTRYEIRQAQKIGVKIVKSTNQADLKQFLNLYNATSGRHNFVQHKGISEELEVFFQEKRGLILFGEYEGNILAAAIIIFFGNQAIYHHGASLSSKIPASYLVQWEAILEAKKRGMKLYNFWGIAPEDKPNHPWRGLSLFKKGFGGCQIEYIHAQDLPLSPLYHFTGAVEAWQKIKRGY